MFVNYSANYSIIYIFLSTLLAERIFSIMIVRILHLRIFFVCTFITG